MNVTLPVSAFDPIFAKHPGICQRSETIECLLQELNSLDGVVVDAEEQSSHVVIELMKLLKLVVVPISLSLKACGLTDEHMMSVGELMRANCSVTMISLVANNIGVGGVTSVVSAFDSCPALRGVSVTGNSQVGMKGVETLLEGVRRHGGITSVGVGGTGLQGAVLLHWI